MFLSLYNFGRLVVDKWTVYPKDDRTLAVILPFTVRFLFLCIHLLMYLFLLLQIASVPKIEFTGLCDSLQIFSVIASLSGDAYLELYPYYILTYSNLIIIICLVRGERDEKQTQRRVWHFKFPRSLNFW